MNKVIMRLFTSIILLTFFISCGRNQSKKIPSNEYINIAKIDSMEIIDKIPSSISHKKKSVQKYVDTLGIPTNYVVSIPLEINKKKIDIRLLLSKSDYSFRGKDYTIVEIEKDTNNILPKSAYECIEGTVELQHWQFINSSSYNYTYKYYRNNKFEENNFVSKRKMIFRAENYNFITVTDIDNDGYEDILILNLANSMRDNEMYQFYRWSQKENRFVFIPDFFKGSAFFGWDQTGKYLITGISDTKERVLYKNKVVEGKLNVVDKCTEYAVSDKQCW